MVTLPDWTEDNRLYHRFKFWKSKCKSLIHGLLYEVPEEQQWYFLTYWLVDTCANLVEKWTMDGRFTEDWEKKLESYWTLFGQHIAPSQMV